MNNRENEIAESIKYAAKLLSLSSIICALIISASITDHHQTRDAIWVGLGIILLVMAIVFILGNVFFTIGKNRTKKKMDMERRRALSGRNIPTQAQPQE